LHRNRVSRTSISMRLILFDFDGTLADTWRDIATALNRALADAGLPPVAPEAVREWIGEGLRRLIERAVPDAERAAARVDSLAVAFGEYYAHCALDTTALYPGVADCLSALQGDALAILSNKPTRFLHAMAEGLGIGRHFTAIVGGDALAVRKPDPAVVAHVVARSGVRPAAVWMIGDSAVDVATGRAAGARTIGCTWGFRSRAELARAGADAIVGDPREIPPLVRAAPG
jgi:phosphoglycolate phosphatase